MKKRILIIQHSQQFGGSQKSLQQNLNELINDFNVTLILPNKDVSKYYNDLKLEIIYKNLTLLNHNTAGWLKFNPKNILKTAYKLFRSFTDSICLLKIIFKTKPNFIHLNSSTLAYYLILKLFFKKKQFSIHVREVIVKGHLNFRKNLLKTFINLLADKVVYISEFEKIYFDLKKSKSQVIYNYLDSKEENSILDLKKDGFKIIFLGGFSLLKGFDELLDVFMLLDNKFKLIILGNNIKEISELDLKQQTKINNLLENNKIIIIEKVSNPIPYIKFSDALIFLGKEPHFPRPIFEAFYASKPCIYYNNNYKNSLIDNSSVQKIKNLKPDTIKNKILYVYDNYKKLERLANKDKKIYQENFSNNYKELKSFLFEKIN